MREFPFPAACWLRLNGAAGAIAASILSSIAAVRAFSADAVPPAKDASGFFSPPAGPPYVSGWAEPGAFYRITLEVAEPDRISCFYLADLLVPCGWANGARVYDSQGRKICFYLGEGTRLRPDRLFWGTAPLPPQFEQYSCTLPVAFQFLEPRPPRSFPPRSDEDLLMFIPPGKDNAKIHVYFGYATKRRAPFWPRALHGRLGQTRGLDLTIVKAHTASTSVAEREKQNAERRKLLLDKFDKDIAEQREKALKVADSLKQLQGTGVMTAEQQIKQEEEKVNSLCAQKEKAAAELNEKEENEKIERLQQLEKFFRKDVEVFSREKADELLFERRPPGDMAVNFAVRFKGLLYVSSPGSYTFAVNSTSSTLLKIGDSFVLGWDDVHEKTAGWEKTADVSLSRGLHQLEFFFQHNDGKPFAAAAWKPEGAGEFRIISAEDFAPHGMLARVTEFVDRRGAAYPAVMYSAVGYLLHEGGRRQWESLDSSFVPGGAEKLVWTMNGVPVARGRRVDTMFAEHEVPRITAKSEDGGFSEFPLSLPRPFKASQELDPLVTISFRTPDMIFDDETLEMSVDAFSELPDEISLAMKISASRDNGMFRNGIESLILPPKNPFEKHKYDMPEVVKKSFRLAGAELKDGLDVIFNFNLPPMNFEKASFRFMPLQKCHGVRESRTGFQDTDGRRVAIVLHRPDLAELRSWSIVDSAVDKFSWIRKVLVICEDFGADRNTFWKRLAAKFADRGIMVEFLPWKRDSEGQPFRESLASFMDKIRASDADRAVIVPPSVDLWRGYPIRTQERVLAAAVMLIHENKNFRTVSLCSPFPSFFASPSEEEIANATKKIAREFGTEFIDVNSFVRKRADWKSMHYEKPDDKSVIEYYPVGMAGETADFISQNVK